MPLAEAFVQDIHAHPDDDARRLIFADWLDEQGSPWGRLIRVQVEQARRAADDPAQDALEAEARVLIARHRAALTQTLPRCKGLDWRFWRGMPGWVVADSFATLRRHADALFAAAPLERVTFRSLRAVRGLAAWPRLPRLRALDAAGLRVGSALALALAASPYAAGLERLDLSNNVLADPSAAALAASPHLNRLTRLDVRHTGLSAAAVAALVARFGPGVRA
jgi:uncharacterized protein (TIGR02996 family)